MSADRNAQLARIHCAKKDLGLDDEGYRAMLRAVGHVESARDLDDGGRARVLDHLSRLTKGANYPGRPKANEAERPEIKKIEALLAEGKLPWSYADAILKRMYRVERVQFASPEQLVGLIAALSRDAERHGRRTR